MNLIVAAIASLISFLIAFSNSDLIGEKNQKLVRSISLMIGILASLSFAYQLVFRFLIIVPAGTVGVVEESLLRKIDLPEKIQAAIQQKIEASQESERQQFINQKKRQELEFELEKAQKEAERKKIEAQGIADAQKIISQGLTEQILELKAIEATQQLAASDNAKVIVIGRSQDGLPMIFQNP